MTEEDDIRLVPRDEEVDIDAEDNPPHIVVNEDEPRVQDELHIKPPGAVKRKLRVSNIRKVFTP